MEEPKIKTLEDLAKEGLDRVAQEQVFFESVLNELNTKKEYCDYFNQFHPDSVKNFKEQFARYKANSLLYGEVYERMEEEKALEYRQEAINMLWEIQQKKLFTLQCKWRAGLINLPGIKITEEFRQIEKEISSCTFLPLVSQEELDEYMEYLEEAPPLKVFNFEEYQYYDHMVGSFADYLKKLEEDPIRNPYYRWWFNKHGDDELKLPDKRGEREEHYWRQTINEGQAQVERIKNDPSYDNRPCIFAHTDAHFTLLAEQFGEEKILEFLSVKKEIDHMYSEWGWFDDALELLKEAGEEWPIEFHKEWKYAIIEAGLRYKLLMTMKALPIVYDEYLFRIENHIAPEPPDYERKDYWTDMIQLKLKQILRGKELLGEKGEWDVDEE